MKLQYCYIFLNFLCAFFCVQQFCVAQVQSVAVADTELQDEITEFRLYQDSLRQILVSKIEQPYITNTILEEFYIRKVIKINKDTISWHLSFNLHGLDCGAPDCYSTSVFFQMPIGAHWSFPERIKIVETEEGCTVFKPFTQRMDFLLVFENNDEVIYHCTKYNRTLVLFKNREGYNVYAYYFNFLKPNQVNRKAIQKILDAFDENEYPFMSTLLSTFEYEHFFD